MKHHYIYRVEDKTTGEFYWGSRSCDCDPKEDLYKGSMLGWKPNRENLIKTTIIEYDTREDANKAEQIVIAYYIDKIKFPLNRNYHIPGVGMCTAGKEISESQKNNISKAQKERLKDKHNHPMYGKKRPEMAERMKGENNPMYGDKRFTGEKNPMYGIKGEQHPSFGKKHTEEAKQKMRDTKAKRKLLKLSEK